MTGRLFIISGCSGVGKGTLVKKFIDNNPSVELSISSTTRSPRPGEKEGVHYFFISKDEFKKSISNDEFLEWNKFGENYYGTKKNFVEQVLDKGKDLILEIEVNGAKQVKNKMQFAKTVFIMPPSMKILEERLRGRKTESEDDIQKRLSLASKEIEESEGYDFKIVNDTLDKALEHLQQIFYGKSNANR